MWRHRADGPRVGRTQRPLAVLVGIGMATALAASGCGGGSGSGASDAGRVQETAAGAGITSTECGTYSGMGCAPERRRIDLAKPTFSNPTRITNPLFPISELGSAVLLGQVEGDPFRSETTLLPETRTVAWDGRRIETLASQYTAYRDGRIEEVALDRYAQADDGSVWYFGEDVVDYADGNVVTTEGTWLAGVEGPPAMIMPATPSVGDVFRPENIVGIVFEEVRVKEVDVTVQSARGPVAGAIIAEELHLDESTSQKTFAPGYGEFSTGRARDLEQLSVAVPADALPGPPPPPLESLRTSASGMLGSVRAGDWEAASATLRRMNAAWDVLRRRQPPSMVAARLGGSLDALARAVKARKAIPASQASIDAWQSILDLRLRHRPPAEIDRARFELWSQQVLVHAAARDAGGVRGDVATLEWIRDRITQTLEPGELAEVDTRLRGMRTAADAMRLAAAADHAVRLGQRLRSL
jgi:hypothetical protein